MLLAIAAFEWRYATRRLLFPVAALGLAGFGAVLGTTGFMARDIHVNAPYAVAMSTSFLSLVSVFALTVLVAPSLLRDGEHHFAEILYATGITKAQYLLGRLAGSWAVGVAAFACGVLGIVAGEMRSDHRLPLDPTVIAASFALALPTLAFVTALLFTTAALTRSALATYVAGVAIYVLYFAVSMAVGSPILASSAPVTAEQLARGALLDPFAITALFDQTRHWTAVERDTLGLRLSGSLLWNRLLWTVASAALVALAHHAFAFRVVAPSRGVAAEPAETTSAADWVPVPLRRDAWGGALRSSLRLELGAHLRSWPFLATGVLWLGTALMTILEEVRRTEFGTALWPVAGFLVVELGQPLLLFGLLVVVYFSGEVVWRERTLQAAEIVDATPAPSGVFLAAKTLALVALVAVLVVLGILAGVVVQVAVGQRPLELATHAALFVFSGWPLALFAALAVLLQTLAPNRYVGMLLVLAAALLGPLNGPGAAEHPLLRYASGPPVEYSQMNGFGPSASGFAAVSGLWTAVATALLLLAAGLWRRGTESPLRSRLRAVRRALGTRGLAALAASLAVAAAWGAFLWYQVDVVHGWESSDERRSRKAAYETTYGALAGVPAPAIDDARLAIDLFPGERRARLAGTYRLENRSASPITPVHVVVPRSVRVVRLTLDGRPGREDARFGAWTFETSIGPGAHAELAFDVAVDRRGVAAFPELDVVENGSFLFGPSVLPIPGYRRGQELDDPAERRRAGLGEQRPAALEEPMLATFELVVSAPTGQQAVAPGELQAEWQDAGRTFRRFASTRRVPFVVAVASARYAVRRFREGEVDVEVLHHPGHETNVDRIVEATAASLRAFGTRFGAYPRRQLRIAEVPASGATFGGYAVPGDVFLTEDRAFLTDTRDEGRTDIVTKRTAHEVAHQWWGHLVAPASGPGASAIVETLTRYSELIVLEETHGVSSVRPVLEAELGSYLGGRRGEPEVPLAQVDGQAWLYYSKGVLVMRALRDLIGTDALDHALRAFAASAVGSGRAPTVDDLLLDLRNATPAGQQALLDEWWHDMVLYDLGVASAAATKAPDGRWRVDVEAKATRTRSVDGRDVPADAPREVEVALYAADPVRARFAEAPLAAERHVLSGTVRFSMTSAERPAFVALDPRLHFLDRNPGDNVRAVEPPGETR